MIENAIAEYDGLLASNGGPRPELLTDLKLAMRERRLMYGGREIGISLRPHLLTRAQYVRLVRASEILAGAFEKLSEAFVAEPRLMARVGMTELETKFALVEPGYRCPAVTTRLDAFTWGDTVKFVEYNAENPSSLTDQRGLNDILRRVPAMYEFARRHELREFDPAAALLSSLIETFREWANDSARVPNVAIVDWADLPTAHEFLMLADSFNEHGVPTTVCSPEELEYDGAHLRCGDFRVDLVYKRIIIHELLNVCGETHPLLRAYADGRVCMVNSLRCKPLHKKAAFELLTDTEDAQVIRFTSEEREVIDACVPWTRRVSERSTTRAGERIDLIEHVRRRRESFVIKPNDDYGGRGVVVGPNVSQSEWDDALASALDADCVVQEVVELHTEVFPIFTDTAWCFQPMYVDTNPFLFRGRVEGAMVRLSDSPVVNVTSGGGEAGFFVIEN